MFKEMLERFEDLATRAKENKAFECEFNCLNVIMGIKSNLVAEQIETDIRQEQLAQQIKSAVKAKQESKE